MYQCYARLCFAVLFILMIVTPTENHASPLILYHYFISPFMQLLFKLSRPIEVAARGYAFVVAFSKTLALHEVCNYCFTVSSYMSYLCAGKIIVIEVLACLILIMLTLSHSECSTILLP